MTKRNVLQTKTGSAVQFVKESKDQSIAITAMGGTGSVDVVARNKNNVPYPYKDSTKTTSGITYTVLSDAGITISGTATSNADFYIFGQNTDNGQYYFIPKGDYTITGTSLGSATGAVLICSDKDGSVYYNNTQLINALKTKDCYLFRIMLRVSSGTIMSGNLYLQIERGDVASAHEIPKANQLTIPDVTTATYPVYLTSYLGINNIFTLSSSQPTFTAGLYVLAYDVERYLKLITSEHSNKVRYVKLITAVLKKVDLTYLNVDEDFDLDYAVGLQLDIAGIILGISRNLTFQPSGGLSSVLNDNDYRALLKAKITINQWNGTMETLTDALTNWSPNVYFAVKDNQDMTVDIIAVGANELQKELIANGYIIPKPAGVRFNYNLSDDVIFAYDADTSTLDGYDTGTWL